MADKKTVAHIYNELMSIPDKGDRNNVLKAISNLYALLNVRNLVPPIAEIMTLLKHDKPTLYFSVKQSLAKDTHLHRLIGIEGSVEVSRQRLNDFFEGEHMPAP